MEIDTTYKNFILDNRTEARQRLALFSFLVTSSLFSSQYKKEKSNEGETKPQFQT